MAVTINGDTGVDKVVDNTIATADLQDGAVTAAKIASGAIPNSYAGTKNLIINGNMQIAQRATSVTGQSNVGGGYRTVDRFAWQLSSGGGTWTQSQEADAPEGFAKSLKLSCTATGTYGATTDWNALYQSIEGFNLQQLKYGTANAESLTLSFWVKSNQIGTYSMLYYGGDSGRGIASEYTVSSANTWEKKTITIAGDTSGIINNDNGSALSLYFTLAAGSLRWSNALQTSWGAYDVNGSVPSSQVQLGGSISDYLQITGVQLEAGTTATDFENLQYGQQLALCQRYFEKSAAQGVSITTANTTSWIICVYSTTVSNGQNYANCKYSVTKRATPTVSIYPYGTPTNLGRVSNDTGGDFGANSGFVNTGYDQGFSVSNNSGGTLTTGAQKQFIGNWYAQAEL